MCRMKVSVYGEGESVGEGKSVGESVKGESV